jgi:UDP:flavonoid glycosyltransferase YjiC (YdhE family)
LSQHAGRPLRLFLGAFGQPGHAFPMLALGQRLVERGHHVVYETWERWREPVESAGMEFLASPEYHVFPTLERPLKPYEAVVRATSLTRERVAKVQPDVVVHDILTLAPALAGELEGVPVTTLVPHLYPVSAPGFPPYALGARLPRTAAGRRWWSSLQRPIEAGLRQGRRELNETRRRLGLPALERLHGGLSDRLCLVATFPELEYPREWPREVQVVGPLMWEPPFGEVALPAGEDPLVLVAPSTAQDPEQRLLRAAVAGLGRTAADRGDGASGVSVRVLASANRRPLPAPVRLAGNVSLVNWVSYSRTMPRADLVVCHAGHGTLVRALACGVPVLAVPHSGDMGENAARLDWSGAGLRLPWRLLSPGTLRLAVRRALEERERLSARAGVFAAWAAARDPATRAAELIEQLAAAP